MRAYSNMPTNEFVAQLRDIAINAGARPLVIDQIDRIIEGPSEFEIEERESDSFNDGRSDCIHEWRMARKQFLTDINQIELSDEQRASVLDAVDRMEPEG